MPTVIACHELRKDTEHWLASPKREEVLPALGASNIRTFVDQQNPHQVAVLMDWTRQRIQRAMNGLRAEARIPDDRSG